MAGSVFQWWERCDGLDGYFLYSMVSCAVRETPNDGLGG